jgi:hypothetical protein
MCEDDYYDYDDDYYDDEDYWEEDDNAYYEEQERLRKEQEAARQKAAAAKSKPSVAGKKSVKSPTTSKKSSGISIGKKPSAKPIDSNSGSTDKDRVERLVTSMGFSSDMAKEALQKYDWDPQRAINFLLANPSPINASKGKSNLAMTMAPPPKPKSNTMAPPPGFGKPKSKSNEVKLNVQNNIGVKGTIAPSPGIKIEAPASKTENSQKKVNSGSSKGTKESENSNNATNAVSSMKQISPEMKKRLKNQKSRLTMVILG